MNRVASPDVPAPISLIPPPDALIPTRHPQAPPPGTVLGPHAEWCFACGTRPRSLQMVMTAGEGTTMHGVLTATHDHAGAVGLVHGGLLSGAFDELFGASSVLVRSPVVTGTMQVSYHRPVPVGTALHLSVTIEAQAGRRLFLSGEGRLEAPAGALALRAHAVYMVVPPEHFAQFDTEHGNEWI